MEAYVLMVVSLAAWGATVVLFKFLMKDSEYAFVIGSIVGLVIAAAAGGAYYQHLAMASISSRKTGRASRSICTSVLAGA